MGWTRRQVEGRFDPWEECEWDFGGQLDDEEPHLHREVRQLVDVESSFTNEHLGWVLILNQILQCDLIYLVNFWPFDLGVKLEVE